MNFKIYPALILATALFTIGCSNDKDLTDYKREKLVKELAALNSAQGDFTGVLTSKRTTQPLGAFKIKWRVSTDVIPSTDESRDSSKPVLMATIEFLGSSHLLINARNGSYDPETGLYQGNIDIPMADKTTKTITLRALINGAHAIGSLEVVDFTDYGATFDLLRDGEKIDVLAKSIKTGPDLRLTQLYFSGSTHFTVGGDKPVNLILLEPPTTSEGEFYNLMSPIKGVTATFNYGNGAKMEFPAGWDQRLGVLNGQNTFGSGQISMSCAQGANTFDCSFSIDSYGVAADTHVTATATLPPDPPDDSSGRDAIRKEFPGYAEYTPGQWSPISIKLSYPARTRLQEITLLLAPVAEKLLEATVVFSAENSVLEKFNTAKWDLRNLTLDGEELHTVPSNPSVQSKHTLSCTDFKFDQQVGEFHCQYSSELLANPINLKFAP